MPAGAFPAGFWPAGAPLPPGSTPTDKAPVVAALFDGATRNVPLDQNGHYEQCHPIDQTVALRCLVARGRVSSDPTLGNRLPTITHRDPQRIAAQVRAFLMERDVLGELVERGDIEIISIEVEGPALSMTNATLCAVTYRNLRLLGSDPRTQGI